jgi:lysophospholipase L1-like esterase
MSVPILTVGIPTTALNQLNLLVGDNQLFIGTATDAEGDMSDHWMEIQNPEGQWSWEGWMMGEWVGGLNGNGSQSVKTARFTFDRAGTWRVRTTAIAPGCDWQTSNEIEVIVRPVPVPDDGGAHAEAKPLNVAVMFDSMGFDKGAGNPVDLLAPAATALLKKPVTIVANVSVDGGFTEYILTTPGLLDDCVSRCKAAKAKWVLIRYGHNDSKKGVQTPADQFKANLLKIAEAYIKEKITPILEYPIYIQPGSYGGLWTRDEIELMDTYCDRIDEIADGKTILIGDTTLWVHFMSHPDQQSDGVHPWRDGVQALANGDASGLVYAINPITELPDPTTAEGYAQLYLTEDPRALSKLLGKSWRELHAGEPDDRDELATCPIRFENRLFDMLGEEGGKPLGPLDGSLNNPGHDMHPQGASGQVYPHNFGPPLGPTIDPGIGNYHYGIPNECIDPMDPANDAGDMYGRILNMQNHAQRTIRLNKDYYMSSSGGDYNSDNGAIATYPKDRFNFPGLDRFQGQANYNLCWNFCPQRNAGGFEFESWGWRLYADLYKRTDPWGAADNVPAHALGSLPRNLIAIADTSFINCQSTLAANAIPMFSTQPGDTSRSIFPIPAEGLATGAFKPNEIIVHIALSTMNELLGVLVWDTALKNSKLKFFAVNGGALPVHSPDYAGLANEGSFKDFIYLDEVILDLQYADDFTICTDATLKPVQPDPGQINLADANQRASYRGHGDISDLENAGMVSSFAKNGCFIVTSERENAYRVYSLTDYILDLWNAWLEPDQVKWEAHYAASKIKKFPLGWSGDRAHLAPKLVDSGTVEAPSCLLASGGVTNSHFGDWSHDFEKCLIGTRSGMVHVINLAPFMDRYKFGWFCNQPVKIYGSFQVGREGCNLTDLKWSRWDSWLTPEMSATGVMEPDATPVPFAQTFFAVARADRTTYSVVTKWRDGAVRGGVYRKISDKRIKDPTCICVNTRSPVIDIGDGEGACVHGIMIGSVGKGKVWDEIRKVDVYPGVNYDPPGGKGYAYVRRMRASGFVFQLTAKNIN